MFRKCISRSLLFRSTVDDFFFNCCKRCLEAFISFLLGLLLAMVSPKFSGKPSPNVVPFWNIQTPLGDGWGVALFQEVLGRVNNDGQFGQQKTWTARCTVFKRRIRRWNISWTWTQMRTKMDGNAVEQQRWSKTLFFFAINRELYVFLDADHPALVYLWRSLAILEFTCKPKL